MQLPIVTATFDFLEPELVARFLSRRKVHVRKFSAESVEASGGLVCTLEYGQCGQQGPALNPLLSGDLPEQVPDLASELCVGTFRPLDRGDSVYELTVGAWIVSVSPLDQDLTSLLLSLTPFGRVMPVGILDPLGELDRKSVV